MAELAPPYDFAVMENSLVPRSLVYNIDTGEEVATFGIEPDEQRKAEEFCAYLNAEAAK